MSITTPCITIYDKALTLSNDPNSFIRDYLQKENLTNLQHYSPFTISYKTRELPLECLYKEGAYTNYEVHIVFPYPPWVGL